MTPAADASVVEPLAVSLPWSALLNHFYNRAGLPLPGIEPLQGADVPEPYRSLLVHSRDMTPTLEAHHQGPIHVLVLNRERREGDYWREVVLRGARDGRPVAYGVIRICLAHLPPAAARSVLEERRPLGRILQTESIPHLSWPQAFFSVEADARLGAILRLQAPGILYGRRNVLLDASRRLIAEVIEILPP